MNTTKLLNIDRISTDEGTQTRQVLDQTTCAEYAQAMLDWKEFPPIDVFSDGTDYWLADGFHRVQGAKDAGLTEIKANIHEGTKRDAILFAVGANDAHGLRRTNADKRTAVELLLRDEEWSQWPDREIARQCAVSHNFVSSLRPICHPMTDSPTQNGEARSERAVNRNGTTYTMRTRGAPKKVRRASNFFSQPQSIQMLLKDTKVAFSRNQLDELDGLGEEVKEQVARKVSEGQASTINHAKNLVLHEVFVNPIDTIKRLLLKLSAEERAELRTLLNGENA